MARSQAKARRHPKRNPQGRLSVMRGGFGFVDTPEGEYFVPASKMRGAFDGDVVEVAPVHPNADRPQPRKEHNSPGRKPSARIVTVLERAHETLIGHYRIAEPFGVVVPDNARISYDIFTMHRDNSGVREGDIVQVRITRYPSSRESALGVVEAVVGHEGDCGLDVLAIAAEHGLRMEFPDAVLEQAAGIQADIPAALAHGYIDLRDRCIFTIDPPDARDFDDALSLDRKGQGWRLGVHIADVSSYVPAGSPLDVEARLRGTSVYLVDRVLPMLPETLSNDVCSLRPHVSRRALTVDMLLDDDGRLQGFSCCRSVIRSAAQLDYGQVQRYLEGDAQAAYGIPAAIRGRIAELDRLAGCLRAERRRAGSLDLESAEVHMLLDAEGHPVEPQLRRATAATSLVEQAMILANACVAARLDDAGWPCLYRTHQAPSSESLARLIPLIQELGLDRETDLSAFQAGDPRALQAVLDAARRAGQGELLSLLLLRSLKRAHYQPLCEGHYGLALDRYAHFTSPIRRYPDLVVHRLLTGLLCGDDAVARAVRPDLPDIGEESSRAERAADDAARKSQELKLVEYLQGCVGEIFPGTIVRMTGSAFFVELENTAVGRVPLADASDEPFALDVERQTLTGRESGVRFRFGQHVLVRLVAARPRERQIDFSLVSRPKQGRGR